ncbi:GGDEF domain-containing protein [Marinomonas sp.]|nr:GGDEF domain-containing protein [Marinomonas sp.]MDB4838062.1 GGDEF domain-containing protein [Marinomonas sp.]
MKMDLGVIADVAKKPLHVSDENYYQYILLLMVGTLGFIIHVVLIYFFYYINITSLAMLNILSVITWAVANRENHQGRHSNSTIIVCLEITIHAACAIYYMGLDSGFQFYLWPVALLASINPKLDNKKSVLIGCIFIIIFAMLKWSFKNESYEHPSHELVDWLYFVNVLSSGVVVILTVLIIRKTYDRQQNNLLEIAIKDELTGLYNRRYINNYFEKSSTNLSVEKEPYCIVIGDVDHFKRINDSWGHDVGDKVLISISHCLQPFLRSSDIACRWGGEEFLILLNNTTEKKAVALIDNLRKEISETILIDLDTSYRVTMSFGVIESSNRDVYENLIKAADNNLYKAKESGRNCIISNNLLFN